MENLNELLQNNVYPGRGIVLGLSSEGQRGMVAYFIMGRSANSRNRVFTESGSGIITEPADPVKLTDPSLIIYAPVRRSGDATIVTNGDQTDTIFDALEGGGSFEDALRTRTFEPDAPNYTPRISGVMQLGLSGFGYKLALLKSEGAGKAVRRFFYEYPQPQPGHGHFIHTYAGDGEPLPSFFGEPVEVAISGDIDTFGEGLWRSLNSENKVALFVRSITLEGYEETRIYNRFNKL